MRCGWALAAGLAGLLALASPLLAQRSEGLGKRGAALGPCDEHMDHGRRQQGRACYLALLKRDSDLGVQAEAWWGVGDFKQANELFRAALAAEPENPDLRVRWGYLFLETYNPGEAFKLFEEALAIDKEHLAAKLGKAQVIGDRFEGKALEQVEEILKADPEFYEAYLLKARMALEEKDVETAEGALGKAAGIGAAQKLSPLHIYAMRASIDLLNDKTESQWTAKALEYNPAFGRIYADPAHFYVITRRYREAVALLQKAVEVDPELWSAHAELAVNLMREDRDGEAKRHLEIAFKGDPFSAKTVNSLRLLDSFKNFKLVSNRDDVLLKSEAEIQASLKKPEVVLMLDKKEADLLKLYAMDLAERSIETFTKKYRFAPKRGVRVELYPNHDDFAVRTMGMPGLGLLGVTFGYVISMDSPSGRTPGSFHWGTTLWHEMAHVFTLEATNHLVPRWYSEGISVYEEWVANESWGDRISPDVIDAIKEDKLLPVAELDKGFIRPRYPAQVPVSYFQAGLVCRMIARQWEFSKLVDLLDGFGKGQETAANIERVLGIGAEEFDKRFKTFIDGMYGDLVQNYPDWRKTIKAAHEAYRKEDWDTAIAEGVKARDIYPQFSEGGSAYVVLANAYEKKGDKAKASAELQRYQKMGGKDPDEIVKLADLLDGLGKRQEAIEALSELNYVYLGDEKVHQKLGGWLFEANRDKEALREYQAVLALNPLDKVGAHFNLARTYHKMKDRENTRRQVLLALEAAPSYRPAQKLLMEIVK